jgi:glucose-1-phosphate thymidylyltransferase
VGGFLVAEGTVTTLRPVTKTVTKQLMPRLSIPLGFDLLSILMLSGVRDIAIVIGQKNQLNFKIFFSDSSQ